MNANETTPTDSEVDRRTRLWEMVRDIRFAMLTTHHSNGHLHSRPVTTQNSELDDTDNIWFFMSRSGEPVADLTADPVVNVAYADPGADSYVSVSGTAMVVEDMAKKQQLWSKMAEAWFPGGVDDPDLALVRVKITHADYWDVRDNKLVQLYKMAKASVTGERPQNLGEHALVRMN